MLVMLAWRGVLVMPAKVEWMIKRGAADLTSRSLQSAADLTSRSESRRGTLVMPDETAQSRDPTDNHGAYPPGEPDG
jgi:hypothetical protein